MIKHIICGSDGSTYGATAEAMALELGAKLGAYVRAIHVVDTALISGAFISDISGSLGFEPFLRLQAQVEQSLQELAQLLKERFLTKAQEANVRGKFQIHHGSTVDRLCEEAQSADLLVIGQRGTAAANHRDFLGATAARLLRRCPVPLLLTPEQASLPKRPLAAFDGSVKAIRALLLAGNLAVSLDVPLKVITFGPEEAQANARLEQAAELLAPFNAKVSFQWERCEVVEQALLALLDPSEYDMLFMGAHGHGRIVEAVLGSTTEYVTRRSPVPVLCITRA